MGVDHLGVHEVVLMLGEELVAHHGRTPVLSLLLTLHPHQSKLEGLVSFSPTHLDSCLAPHLRLRYLQVHKAIRFWSANR
jgi:hypothetical protein